MRERLLESRYTNTDLKDKLQHKEDMLQALVSCAEKSGSGASPQQPGGSKSSRGDIDSQRSRRNSVVGRFCGRRFSNTGCGMFSASRSPNCRNRVGVDGAPADSAPPPSTGWRKERRASGDVTVGRMKRFSNSEGATAAGATVRRPRPRSKSSELVSMPGGSPQPPIPIQPLQRGSPATPPSEMVDPGAGIDP